MDDQLLAYLLNALDGDERVRVEALLAGDSAAQHRLAVLRLALEPLAADVEVAPPADLAERTLVRINDLPTPHLPRAPRNHGRWPLGPNPRWRRADVLVAATLMLTVFGLGLPWVYTQRMQRDGQVSMVKIVECKDNLRQLYAALKTYSDKHNDRYPNPSGAKPPHLTPGLVTNVLRDAGAPVEPSTVRCPAIPGAPPELKPVKEVLAMDDATYKAYLASLSGNYAYSIGYLEDDTVVGWKHDKGKPHDLIPIMADCPPANVYDGNSKSHGGKGQNVLFQDGHVKFCTDRKAGLDLEDIYTNKKKKVAPGCDANDAVLATGEVPQ